MVPAPVPPGYIAPVTHYQSDPTIWQPLVRVRVVFMVPGKDSSFLAFSSVRCKNFGLYTHWELSALWLTWLWLCFSLRFPVPLNVDTISPFTSQPRRVLASILVTPLLERFLLLVLSSEWVGDCFFCALINLISSTLFYGLCIWRKCSPNFAPPY